MTVRDKTAEEVAEDLLANEQVMDSGEVAIYKIDVEKLKQYSYEAIARALDEMFGTIAVDVGEDGVAEKMFLDSELGKFVSRDYEKVDILE